MTARYDSVIIGGGPAGLSAALYLGRGLVKTALLERGAVGGQMLLTDRIYNYPGFAGDTHAFDIVEKMDLHARQYEHERKTFEVARIENAEKEIKTLVAHSGETIETKSIIIASGAHARKLGAKGEGAFIGKGVSYCGSCDGAFFRDKTIAVIGGGDTAFDETLFLARFAKKIYLIHRRDKFRAAALSVERVKENEKVEFVLESVVEEIFGTAAVEGIRIRNVKTSEERSIALDGVFIFVGLNPMTQFLEGSGVMRNESGYVKTDINMRTTVEGIFAAGDVIEKEERQVANAVGDGAVAACQAIKYLDALG